MVNREEKPYYEITAGEYPRYIATEEVAKLIFHKMKGQFTHMYKYTHVHTQCKLTDHSTFTETAQSALGSDITDVVVTVPFEFAHAQKRALR